MTLVVKKAPHSAGTLALPPSKKVQTSVIPMRLTEASDLALAKHVHHYLEGPRISSVGVSSVVRQFGEMGPRQAAKVISLTVARSNLARVAVYCRALYAGIFYHADPVFQEIDYEKLSQELALLVTNQSNRVPQKFLELEKILHLAERVDWIIPENGREAEFVVKKPFGVESAFIVPARIERGLMVTTVVAGVAAAIIL